jgi:hypothetical protein
MFAAILPAYRSMSFFVDLRIFIAQPGTDVEINIV